MGRRESYDVFCQRCGARTHVSYTVRCAEDYEKAYTKLENMRCPKCGGTGFGRYKPII